MPARLPVPDVLASQQCPEAASSTPTIRFAEAWANSITELLFLLPCCTYLHFCFAVKFLSPVAISNSLSPVMSMRVSSASCLIPTACVHVCVICRGLYRGTLVEGWIVIFPKNLLDSESVEAVSCAGNSERDIRFFVEKLCGSFTLSNHHPDPPLPPISIRLLRLRSAKKLEDSAAIS